MIVHDCEEGPIRALAFSPDGALLACAAGDGHLYLWDSSGLVWSRRMDRPAYSLSFHPDGKKIAIGHLSGVWLLDSESGKSIEQLLPGLHAPIIGAAFVDKGNKILLASGDPERLEKSSNGLTLWPMPCPQKKRLNTYEFGPLLGFDASPKANRFAWLAENRRVRTASLAKQDIFDFTVRSPGRCIRISENGFIAVGCGWDIPIFSLEWRSERYTLKGHKGNVSGLAFTPDERSLLSASWDATVKLWDLENAREKASYTWNLGQMSAVEVAPDGLRYVCGSAGGKVLLWDSD